MQTSSHDAGRPSILVVDDEQSMLIYTKTLLETVTTWLIQPTAAKRRFVR